MFSLNALIITIGVLLPGSDGHCSIVNSLIPFLSPVIAQSSFWSSGESMPIPRQEIAGALLDGKIYIVGGSDQDGLKDNVDVFDPKTDEWGTAAPLPEPRNHIAVAAYDGKLYSVGGFDDERVPTDQLLIYDPETDEWQEGEPMPAARAALTAEFIDGSLYAVGGVDADHNVVSTNEAYDPETNTWTERSPMPTGRHHLASAVTDGKMYAIGGRLLGNGVPSPVDGNKINFNDNEAYDPKEDSWTVLSPMPTNRSGLAAAAVNSEIYTFGGESLEGGLKDNERYDTERNVWTIDQPMLASRLGLEAITFENRIYVFGGKSDLNDNSGKTVETTEIFYPNSSRSG